MNVLRTLALPWIAVALLLQGCSSGVPVELATEQPRPPVDPREVDPVPADRKPTRPLAESARTERESWSQLVKSGREHLKRGELPEAEDSFTRAYDLSRSFRAGDVRNKSSSRNLQRLAAAYRASGDSASFGRVMELIVYIAGDNPTSRSPEVARLLQELAATRTMQERHPEAKDALLLALEILEENDGSTKAAIAGAYSQLALVHIDIGDFAAAQAAVDRAAEVALSEREAEDEKSPLYAEALIPRAKLEFARGNVSEARNAMREALEITEQHFGAESKPSARIAREFALFEQQAGNYGEASRHFDRVISIWDVLTGERYQRAQSRNELAWFLVETGQPELAEAPARSAYELFESQNVGGQPLAAVADTLATALRDQQKHAEAESFYRVALTEGAKAEGLAGWDLTGIADRYAELLDRTGRSEDAEELRRRWHATDGAPDPPADAPSHEGL